jgi:hypothetical protein
VAPVRRIRGDFALRRRQQGKRLLVGPVPGTAVIALFKASSVVLGVSGWRFLRPAATSPPEEGAMSDLSVMLAPRAPCRGDA